MFLFPKAAHKIRVPARHADGAVKFQRVRILKSRSLPLAFTVLAFPLTILLLETSEYWLPDDYKKAIQSTQTRAEEEKKKQRSSQQEAGRLKNSAENRIVGFVGNESNASKKLLSAQDVSFVLRLPYIQQKHPVPYKETDMEWIEASKLMNDPARLAALKKAIVEETIKGWVRDKPTFECIKLVSPGKLSKGVESIFDVVVPLHRPPRFEQHAVVWLPGGPRLAKLQLSNTTASRILRIWYPEVSIYAFWNAGRAFTYASYQSAKSRFQSKGSSNTSVVTPFSSPVSPTNTAALPASSARKPGSSTNTSLDAAKTEDPLLASFFHLAKTLAPESPLAQAKMAFWRSLTAMQIQNLQYVPEGAVVFQGYVSLVGYRGKVKSTVSAIYLPAEDRLILPIILESTEVLPDTTRWHQVDPRKHQSQSSQTLTDSINPAVADLQATIDRRAKSLMKRQALFETFFSAQAAAMESSRQQLARDIQKLEEQGGTVSVEAKRQATTRIRYAKKEGNGKLAEMLHTLSSTDPHLRELIEQIACGKFSPAQLKEFESHIQRSKSIIVAQEAGSKTSGSEEPSSRLKQSKNRLASSLAEVETDANKVTDLNVMRNKKELGDMKDVHSGKNDESEKSATGSIEVNRGEERKKE